MPLLFNLPLARAVLERLHAVPHLHDHTVWRAERPEGTAYSVAGWVVTLAGAQWTETRELVRYKGEMRAVPMLARELLGLPHAQARSLFYDCDAEQAVRLLSALIDRAANIQGDRLRVLEIAFSWVP
ncbi:hypothetical protein ACWEKT_02865 [Nocardia takedensis]